MNQNKVTGTLQNVLIWLSGADREVLTSEWCPKWEKIKYEAFGASVLVPVLFGMIASTYAVSTLTSNWLVIGIFTLVWGFIILTIDRVLLSTYRAFVPLSKKWIQFCLRISVAILMGLTVSHPLTLLLFKDTITSEIEKERTNEMLAARQKTDSDKESLENRIKAATEQLALHQKKYQETVNGDFLNTPPPPVVVPAPEADGRFADIDAQIDAYKQERDLVRNDLEKWQETYDAEVRGIRSGKSGIGPNARAIERDHLIWRRDEIKRLNGVIGGLTARRTELSSEIMNRTLAVSASLQESRRDLEKQKIAMFASQQGQLLDVIKGQIDSTTAELADLRRDASQLAMDTSDRVASLKVEKRADLMAQTNMLHKMFKSPDAGGTFALVVYIVLVLLFTLIDTIPLVVKFCTVPGLYDKYLYYLESDVKNGKDVPDLIDDTFRTDMKKRMDIHKDLRTYSPRVESPPIAALPRLPEVREDPLRLPGTPVEEIFPAREKAAQLQGKEPVPERVEAGSADEDDFVVEYKNGGIEALEGAEIRAKQNSKPRPLRGRVQTSFPLESTRNESPAGVEANELSEFPAETPSLNGRPKADQPGLESPVVEETPELEAAPEIGFEEEEVSPLLVGEVYNDEPSMLEPGFGAVILNGAVDSPDFEEELEIPRDDIEEASQRQAMKSLRGHFDEPQKGDGEIFRDDAKDSSRQELDFSKPNLKNGKKVQKAAGGLAIMPINGSRKSNQ